MRKSYTVLPICLSIILTSCTTVNSTENFIQNESENRYTMLCNTYKSGAVYATNEVGGTMANYLDYESKKSVPLCNKPNCVHKDAGCLAFNCLSNNPMTVAYDDHIFWFESSFEIIDSVDGKDTEASVKTLCKRGKLSTGEVEIFTEIPDVFMNSATEMVISNNSLYVIGCKSLLKNNDGTWTEISRIGEQYLYSINLENADVRNYGLINDAPTAEYNWTLDYIVESSVSLTGIYNNKLYMSYRYVDEPSDITNYFITHEIVHNDILDAIPWNNVNKCLDLDSGEITESDLPAAELIQDNHYIYYDGKYHVMAPDGSVTDSNKIYVNEWCEMTFVNGKLWKGSENMCFDIEAAKEFKLSNTYSDKNIFVLDYYDNKYVVQYYDKNYEVRIDFVSEQELLRQ